LSQNFYLFSPVSLTPLINIHLRISPRIFEKFEMVLMGYSGARGTLIYEKNLKAKISCQTPFKVSVTGKIQVLTIKQGYICKLIVEEGGQM
jgi:hypothetical protein